MAVNPNHPGAPRFAFATFVNADGTTAKTLFTAGSSGSKLVSITAHSSDTAARDVRINITRSGTNYPVTTVNIPIGAGNTSSVPPVALLQTTQSGGTPTSPTGILPIDQDGQVYILLQNGDSITCSMLVAVTAATQITLTAIGCDF